MNKDIDNIKYKIINLENKIDTKLMELKELNCELGYIWIELEKLNSL